VVLFQRFEVKMLVFLSFEGFLESRIKDLLFDLRVNFQFFFNLLQNFFAAPAMSGRLCVRSDTASLPDRLFIRLFDLAVVRRPVVRFFVGIQNSSSEIEKMVLISVCPWGKRRARGKSNSGLSAIDLSTSTLCGRVSPRPLRFQKSERPCGGV
jgi:hypothetical protein